MAAGIIKPCVQAARFCARLVVTLAFWTAWLALALLLAAQIYIASAERLPVPAFFLRAISERLAASGVTVTFGSATFDPAGRILIENARIKLSSFSEPIATARALYARIDPFSLVAGRFEPLELRAFGVTFLVPAMLSSSGRAEELVRDLNAQVTPQGNELRVDYLSCRLGAATLSVRGSVHLGTISSEKAAALPIAEFLSLNYAPLSKEFSHGIERLAALDRPIIGAVLEPSETRTAIVRATFYADGFASGGPSEVRASRLIAVSQFPLLGRGPATAAVDAWVGTARGPGGFEAEGVRARVRGFLDLDAMTFQPKEAQIAAGGAGAAGIRVLAPIARLSVGPGSKLHGTAAAWLFGRPVAVAGDLDRVAGTADLSFDALLSPEVMGLASEKIGHDLRTFADFSEPLAVAGKATLKEGWRLASFSARFETRNVVGHTVKLDEVRGRVNYDGVRLFAPEVYARIGENYARGSYDQDIASGDHRFLLVGRLRPLEISAWFGDWWPRRFADFAFPGGPPSASVDVHGRWGREASRFSSEFVFADGNDIAIRGVAFERLHTRLFIRPSICDGLEFSLFQKSGSARGTFTFRSDLDRGVWQSFDIDANSTLDPTGLAKLVGSDAADILSPFSFPAGPPAVEFAAHFDGPAVPEPRHSKIHVEVRSADSMVYHGIQFDQAAFTVDSRDGDLAVDRIAAGFAGGTLTGKATVASPGTDRRVAFSAKLANASLGRTVTGVGPLAFPEVSGTPASIGAFARDKSGVRLDLSAAAEGLFGQSMSYHGAGDVRFQGAELGSLPLLGGLSKLLRVTSLRFTSAQSAFKIDGRQLEFDDLTVTGANSLIRARGTYALDLSQLDFNAKIFPFQESKSMLKVFDVLSKPLSEALEVRLTGTFEKPSWNFAHDPLNLLRNYPANQPAAPSPLAHPPQ